MYPAGLPPRSWPESPYLALSSGQPGTAGWDPIAGKITVVYFHTMLQFDFDGVTATSGCAYPNFNFSLKVAALVIH